ncbi:DUF1775 domain-containing protein [Streptomyces sp. NRRL B-3229]|uniref:DUF1775 domain-containing protein n=1 Tax=Streptomyces sp. NRRL B-3229 TaxID=1463836 RepID=UPI0007C4C4F7
MSTARTTLRRTGAATALAAVGVLAAAGIASGHVTVEDFDVAFGQLPDDTGQLVFKTVQTYSDGKTVRWIERAASGDDEPENPAPVLKLTAKDADTADSVPVTAKSAESETLSASSSDSTARGIGVAGLVVGVLGLSAAVFAVLRGRSPGSHPPRSAVAGWDDEVNNRVVGLSPRRRPRTSGSPGSPPPPCSSCVATSRPCRRARHSRPLPEHSGLTAGRVLRAQRTLMKRTS